MELIKRKILLENYIDRVDNSSTYGMLTATSFYINVMLTQDIDDMAMFTDIIYIPKEIGLNAPVDYTILTQKLSASGITFPFMRGILPSTSVTGISTTLRTTDSVVSDYYTTYTGTQLTLRTSSRVEEVRAYDNASKYKLNFDTLSETYTGYTGNTVHGVSRVTSFSNPFTYVIDADKNDPQIGTYYQKNGLMLQDYTGSTNYTNLSYFRQGWNQTDTSLSASTKEEYLFGIISKPEVESDVFIDRGIITIYEKHLKLSEITNLNELARYGRGYYNLTVE